MLADEHDGPSFTQNLRGWQYEFALLKMPGLHAYEDVFRTQCLSGRTRYMASRRSP
ncbi:MAG: hypothetical protein ACD_23C00755G0008, partial [uncultured bacterium]